ncbi:MAG: zinc-binding dehydrogenase [Actinobacteria bacterium]|nr:zinc-binding dehydrogenase [Actinomycetota bacterium]
MREGRRLVFTGNGRPLELRVGAVPDPGPGHVLLRTVIGGVCGSDAHRLSGDQPDPGRPVCFGHEGIGRVEALGAGRTVDGAGEPLRAGDLVYWTPSGPTPGSFPATGWPPPDDVPNPASYQDYATLGPENHCYRIPAGVDPEAVIAFGCAMPTALGGLDRLGPIEPGQAVLVQGSGPVGLSVTLLAALGPAAQVIVIGAPDDRLAAAARLGASTVIPLVGTSEAERREAVLDLTGGRWPEVIVEATGRVEAFPEGMALLAPGGRYLVLGIYSGHQTVELDVVRLNNLSQRVIGSLGPSRFDDYTATIALARDHGARLGFADLVAHRAPLADAEAAIGVAGRGEAIKAVVLPETG